jgi:hypothetical protein
MDGSVLHELVHLVGDGPALVCVLPRPVRAIRRRCERVLADAPLPSVTLDGDDERVVRGMRLPVLAWRPRWLLVAERGVRWSHVGMPDPDRVAAIAAEWTSAGGRSLET